MKILSKLDIRNYKYNLQNDKYDVQNNKYDVQDDKYGRKIYLGGIKSVVYWRMAG